MTTIISRVYADKATAEGVVAKLREAGHPEANIDMISAGDADMAESLAKSRVGDTAAAVYTDMLKGKASMVVVRCLLTPFGAARNAMSIVDGAESLPADLPSQNRYVREQPQTGRFLSVMTDHPLMLTSKYELRRERHRMSDVMSWRLLSPSRPRTSAISGGRFMSQRILPFPLLSRKKSKQTAIPGGKRMLYKRA